LLGFGYAGWYILRLHGDDHKALFHCMQPLNRCPSGIRENTYINTS
jgi:hypothetical protein